MSIERRALLASVVCACALIVRKAPARQSPVPEHEEPRLVDPPGELPAELAPLLAKVREELSAGRKTTAEVLADPQWMPLHPHTRFRETIREFARPEGVLVTPGEPGDKLAVSGRIIGADGRGLEGVIVYAYQTSAKGWYSDRAPHIGGMSGDEKHARLFTYVRTDGDGRFTLRTVHPGGYPRSDLPCHIHVEIFGKNDLTRVTEINFDDDPRLTTRARLQAGQDGYEIVSVKRAEDGSQTCSVEFSLPRARKG